MQVVVHETGHAAAAKGLGWEVNSFRPYPGMCGTMFAMGCVSSSPPGGLSSNQFRKERKIISASGSLASSLSVLMLAPLQPKGNSFWAHSYNSMLDYQTMDWIFYTIVDSITGQDGDWTTVAEMSDKSPYLFIIPAALNYWLLKKYRSLLNNGKHSKNNSLLLLPQKDHILAKLTIPF